MDPTTTPLDAAALLLASEEFKKAYDDLVRIKLAFVAAAAILLWDYVVTFQLERTVLWTRKNSIAKLATLLGRYYVLLVHLPICGYVLFGTFSASACRAFFRAHPLICLFAMLPVQIILIVRVFAIYEKNRYIIVSLTTLVVLGQAAAAAVPSRATPMTMPSGMTSCQAMLPGGYDYTWTIFLPAVLVEAICLLLVVAKYVRCRRSSDFGNTLMGRLAYDSFVYFIPIAIVNSANMILFALKSGAERALLAFPAVSFTVILSTRLMLAFYRDAANNDLDSFGSLQSSVLSFVRGKRSGSSRATQSSRAAHELSTIKIAAATPHVLAFEAVSPKTAQSADHMLDDEEKRWAM